MPQIIRILRCYKCDTFQTDIVKKLKKWECKLCGEKQSVKQEFGRGTGPECRLHIQKLNKEINSIKSIPLDIEDDFEEIGQQNMKNNGNDRNEQNYTSKWEKFVEESDGSDNGLKNLDKKQIPPGRTAVASLYNSGDIKSRKFCYKSNLNGYKSALKFKESAHEHIMMGSNSNPKEKRRKTNKSEFQNDNFTNFLNFGLKQNNRNLLSEKIDLAKTESDDNCFHKNIEGPKIERLTSHINCEQTHIPHPPLKDHRESENENFDPALNKIKFNNLKPDKSPSISKSTKLICKPDSKWAKYLPNENEEEYEENFIDF